MEDALKALNLSPKMLERRTNALWDILLLTEQQTRELAGSILNTKELRLITEYMGTWRTRVKIHGVPMDICNDRMGVFFSKYGQVEVKIKTGIAPGDMELSVMVDRKSFIEIPNVLVCREKKEC